MFYALNASKRAQKERHCPSSKGHSKGPPNVVPFGLLSRWLKLPLIRFNLCANRSIEASMLLRGHPMLDAGGALPASQQRLTQVHPAPSTCQRLVGALHSTRAEHHQHLIRKWGAASPHRGGTTVTKALADLPLPAPAPPPPVPAPAPAPLSVSVQAPGTH